MAIQSVNNITTSNTTFKKRFNVPKITGYAALGFGLASVVAVSKKKIKMHKMLAYLSGAMAVLHTGVIEYYHLKRSKKS
ncbi:hypothetical protein HDR58_06425 [bacterium]|nr:hypothetical protein [bacterium]